MPTSLVGVINKGRGLVCGRGENRDRLLCPLAAGSGVVLRGDVAPWDREVSPGFRAVWRGERRECVGGARAGQPRFSRGITLIEMLIVMALIALVAGMAAPSVSAGLDSLRLRSTSDAMIGFLNAALARADTRQQVVEILISPAEGTLTAVSGDQGYKRRLEIASPIKILSVRPVPAADTDEQNPPRRFLVYPGGTVPKIVIEIGNSRGRKRLVSIDPVTGVPQSNAQ
jgi:prepilin-type N-terminal cleavage/methylation domain-containing protein